MSFGLPVRLRRPSVGGARAQHWHQRSRADLCSLPCASRRRSSQLPRRPCVRRRAIQVGGSGAAGPCQRVEVGWRVVWLSRRLAEKHDVAPDSPAMHPTFKEQRESATPHPCQPQPRRQKVTKNILSWTPVEGGAGHAWEQGCWQRRAKHESRGSGER
eukprot:2866405-Rhodomonas_salina.3